jgi:hypothetical protein
MSFQKHSAPDKADLNLSQVQPERTNGVETIDTMEDGPLPPSGNTDRFMKAHASLNEVEVRMRDDLTHEELAEANKALSAAQQEYESAARVSRPKKATSDTIERD